MIDTIQILKPNQYEVYVRAVDKNLSYLAIASELNIPIGTVKSRLNRARHALRKHQENIAPAQ